MAKKKIPARRNPMMRELMSNGLYREKRTKSASEKDEQRNQFSRSAKHKKANIDENDHPYYAQYIDIDANDLVVSSAETGERLCSYRIEKKVTRSSLSEPTGRIILDLGDFEHIVSSWDEAADYLMRMMQSAGLVTEAKDQPNVFETFFEDFQWGDRVKVTSGPLKAVLDKAEKQRKKDNDPKKKKAHDEAVVKVPNGPATTVGITVDGEYYIVDEKDLELVFEGFRADDDFKDLLEFKFVEIQSGVRIPISGEEQDILDMCKDKLYKSSLDERNKEIARRMVSRSILNRHKDEKGKLYFVPNTKKLTRF